MKEYFIVYSKDEFDKASKKAERREKFQKKVNDVKNWFVNNKEIVMVLGPTAIGAVAGVAKIIGKNAALSKEKNVKDLYCYDRSLGHYWSLKRELTNREWVEIDQRKKNGERLADILESFKVLK